MERDDKKALKIVLGVFGCLGCAGIGFFLAVFGVGFWVSSVTPPMLPPITPPGPSAPAAPNFVRAQTPADWTEYEFAGPCPNNANLRLGHFRTAYPGMYKVLACQEQEPRAWSYVTFHLEDAAGHADRQITLGHARGAPTQLMLRSVSAQFVAQLGAPAPRLVDATPFAARGANLTHRNAVFTISAESGVFLPGDYLVRQVVIPGPGLNAEGINLTLIHRVTTTESAAVLESDVTLQHALASVQF